MKGKSTKWIGVKGMGELDESPFRAACKKKYAGPEAEEKAVELCSLWEDHLRDPNWHPFRVVAVEDGDGHKVWLFTTAADWTNYFMFSKGVS